MSRNREPVKPVESESESGEDEESSEEVDSDSEPEQTQKKSQPQMAAKSANSSSEEEEDSESESESEPIEETQRPITGAKKAISLEPTKSAAAAKRPAEEDTAAAKGAKKSRKIAEPEAAPEKKVNLIQRLWSEDDEMVILQGMINYASEYKSDPISDLNAFHNFIKTSLHIDVTRSQLQDKIRRLKKKYKNNKSKEKEGKERTFSKSHEQNAYDLSKLIWGNENVARKTASKKVNAVAVSTSVGATTEETMLLAGGEYFESGQGLDREQDWQKLRVEEMQLYAKQLELRLAQTKLVLEVMIGKDQ